LPSLALNFALHLQDLVGLPGKLHGLNPVPGRLELTVDVSHLDLAGVPAPAAGQGDKTDDKANDRQHEGGGFGKKESVLGGQTVHC
jgi:hypothetical protein